MRKKSTGKNTEKKVRENMENSHVTSGDVTSDHAQWSDPPHDPPQILTELCPYTTTVLHRSHNETVKLDKKRTDRAFITVSIM